MVTNRALYLAVVPGVDDPLCAILARAFATECIRQRGNDETIVHFTHEDRVVARCENGLWIVDACAMQKGLPDPLVREIVAKIRQYNPAESLEDARERIHDALRRAQQAAHAA